MDSLTTLNTFAATSVPYTDEAAGSATLTNRYQINGVIDTSLPVMENLEKICSASGSWLSYDVSTGKWGVVINRTGSSVASFNNSNILGPISVSGTGLKDLYNAVRVEFPNRDIRDASDFVKIELPAGDKNSNELPNTLNLAYDNINEPVQAQLLGFIELKQSRVDLIITFETDYSNINLQAGDLIDVTNTQFSFSAKIFRIITIAEKQGDSALTLEITALEYDTTVYSTADLSRFVRSDSTGIITIGSIGTPGTPVVTKFESDVRPRIVVTSTAPTGIVEAMEFWRTTDVLLAESARSYQQIGTQRPTGGGTYSSGTTVTFELDTLNSSNFFIKTRGINDLTVGQFSTPSGLVEYVPEQVTDAIDPNTNIKDALGAIATAQTLFTLLGLLDDLLGAATGKSIWTRIKELFEEATGLNLNTPGAIQGAVFPSSTLTTTAATGNGTTVTLSFATQATAPFNVGQTITVSGLVPAGYNGAQIVTAVTVNSVSYANATTGAQTTPGTITFTGTITVNDDGVLRTNALTSLNFAGAGVTATSSGGAVTVTIPGAAGGGGLNILNSPVVDDYLVYNGKGWVAVPTCCTPVPYPEGWEPGAVDNSEECELSFSTKFPPDRNDFQDPTTNPPLTSDTARVTGSYFIYVNPPEGRSFKGNITAGTGTAYLYESDGTLKDSKTAAECIFTKDLIEIPFITRDYATDYYILIDEGLATYCNCPTPAIKADTLEGSWNFNTPPSTYSLSPYAPTPNNFVSPTVSAPLFSSSSPTGTVCPSPRLRLTFNNETVAGTGSIEIKRVSDDITVDTISASSGSGIITYSNVTPSATSGTGTDAKFNITSYPAVYTVSGQTTPPYYTAAVASEGKGYEQDDTITIPGTLLGGTSSGNDCILTVLDTKGEGETKAIGDNIKKGQIVSVEVQETSTPAAKTLDFGIINSLAIGPQYYVVFPQGTVRKNVIDCNERDVSPVAALTKNANTYFSISPVLIVTGKTVKSEPVVVGNDQKVNPQSNIGIVFNQTISFHTSGSVRLYNSSGTEIQAFDVAKTFTANKVSELIWIEGSTLYVNPTVDMNFDTTYYVLIDAGVVVDSCSRVYTGLTDVNTVRFKTDAGPVATLQPLNASGSVNQTGIVMDFDRTVEPSTGLVSIIDVNTSTTIATVASTDPSVSITEI